MNIIDEIHAQLYAYKLPSETYIKHFIIGIVILITIIASEDQGRFFIFLLVILTGVNKVVIADLSTSQIKTVWRFLRIPIQRRRVIATGVKQIILSMGPSVECRIEDNASLLVVNRCMRYKNARSLADWLVRHLQVPLKDQLFNDGKLTEPFAIDYNLLKQFQLVNYVPRLLDDSLIFVENKNNSTLLINLPRKAYPFKTLAICVFSIGIIVFLSVLFPIVWYMSWMPILFFILIIIKYIDSLFSVRIRLKIDSIKIYKIWRRRKIAMTDLMDIAIIKNNLILVTKDNYYFVPYQFIQIKAGTVREMIINHLVLEK